MIKIMRIKIYFGCALLLIMFVSCNDGKLFDSEIKESKKVIIDKGDKYTYTKLYFYYSNKKEYELILPYTLVMAYKYNDADAYFQIYDIMIRIYNNGEFDYTLIKNLTPKNREFAMRHLLKSSELGDFTAKGFLAKYYREGNYLPKNIELATKLEEEIKIR
jgi:TPR repeat protein